MYLQLQFLFKQQNIYILPKSLFSDESLLYRISIHSIHKNVHQACPEANEKSNYIIHVQEWQQAY